MNYKYKIEDSEIILSEEEHKAVTENVKRGVSLTYLRGGKEAINSNFIRWIKPTDQPSELEHRPEEKRLEIAAPKEDKKPELVPFKELIKSRHFDSYTRNGWTHHDNCICKSWESVNNSSLTTYVEPTILKDKINKKEVLNEWLNK